MKIFSCPFSHRKIQCRYDQAKKARESSIVVGEINEGEEEEKKRRIDCNVWKVKDYFFEQNIPLLKNACSQTMTINLLLVVLNDLLSHTQYFSQATISKEKDF